MTQYILALDLGTTGNRAILFDKQGQAVAEVYKKFKQYYPQSGWVEHDPQEILQSTFFVMREVVKKARIKTEQIAALGLTNQRETTVVWDAHTGEPVYNAIVWQDRRTAAICAQLKKLGLEKMVREKTGLLLDPYFSATKLAWILRNAKIKNTKNLKFGTIDSWILWNLTEENIHATDVSNASRTMLWNIKTHNWDKQLLLLFNIPKEILPRVLPSSGDFGMLKNTILGRSIPIASVCGDQQAALFGQTCFDHGDLKITYGTGAFLLLNTGNNLVIPKQPLVSTVAWQIGKKITYALEGSMFSCGAALNWLQNDIQLIKNGPDADLQAGRVKDCGGVIFVPALFGLGAPYWQPQARAIISGLSQYTKREHLVRATLEGIASQVADIIEVLKQSAKNISLKKLKVDGGVSKSDIVLQEQADLSRVRIHRAVQFEATALGAAMLAGLHVGFWKNQKELSKISKVSRIFNPRISAIAAGAKRQEWARAIKHALEK